MGINNAPRGENFAERFNKKWKIYKPGSVIDNHSSRRCTFRWVTPPGRYPASYFPEARTFLTSITSKGYFGAIIRLSMKKHID